MTEHDETADRPYWDWGLWGYHKRNGTAPRVTLIVAYNEQHVIGDKLGKVPWWVKEDLQFFRETTTGHICMMGRKTWDSIPGRFRPLPDRVNIILSREPEKVQRLSDANVYVSDDVRCALGFCIDLWPGKEIFVIGGAEVYRFFLDKDLADRVLASEIKGHLDVEAGTYFPDLKQAGWSGEVVRRFDEFDVVEYVPGLFANSLNKT